MYRSNTQRQNPVYQPNTTASNNTILNLGLLMARALGGGVDTRYAVEPAQKPVPEPTAPKPPIGGDPDV